MGRYGKQEKNKRRDKNDQLLGGVKKPGWLCALQGLQRRKSEIEKTLSPGSWDY